jgi:hypothetical protein
MAVPTAKELGIRLYGAVKARNVLDIKAALAAGAATNLNARFGAEKSFADVYEYALDVYLDDDDAWPAFNALVTHAKYTPQYLTDRLGLALDGAITELNDNENIAKYLKVANALLKAGADPNGKVDGAFLGFTVVAYPPLLRFLLRNGLNPDLEDDKGVSLLVLANHRGVDASIKILKPAGAKNVTDTYLPHFEPRYGVELEICVKLTRACLRKPVSVDPRTDPWIKMFAIYADAYIKGTPVAKRLAEKYGYVYVTELEKYGYSYIYDLKTGELIPQKGKIAYDRPFFTIDRSVYCGDHTEDATTPAQTRKNRKTKSATRRSLEKTFHIEFVSPILESFEDLEENLRLVGLGRPRCFISNLSAGYHVNVSLFDVDKKKPVILSKQFFERTFYPQYKAWEAKTYPKVREFRTKYAPPVSEVADADAFLQTGKSKYVALFRKNPYLLEFRLFGSDNKIPLLVHYTKEAVGVLEKAYTAYNLELMGY